MKQFLNQIHKVDEQVLDEYLSHWKPVEIKRKTILTEQGKTEKFLYLLTSGIQKAYFIKQEKEHVVAFITAPSFSGIFESFFSQTASNYYLESISTCELLRLPYLKHMQLIEEYPCIETLFRKALELALIGLSRRQYELMAYDIEMRFNLLMKRSPHLLHMAPQKDLASYLNMDPTNFSKLINSNLI